MAGRILGISAFYKDSAAAMVVNGEIVAAAQEERFSGVKHDRRFPTRAVAYCLSEAGITPAEVDHLVFYDRPRSKLERLIERCLAWAPSNLRTSTTTLAERVRRHILRPRQLHCAFPGKFIQPLEFADHNNSHAACAFFPSPFEEAAILVWDDSGDQTRVVIGRGRGNRIELLRSFEHPVSLGPLYSAVAHFCGFKGIGEETQFTNLAPYGNPKYVDLIRDKLIELKPDGSFTVNNSYFHRGSGRPKPAFDLLFKGRPRHPDAPITRREIDLARSIQTVGASILLHLAKIAREVTGCRNLCLAGDMGLQCVAYGGLVRENVFDDVWMPASDGDASGAMGAALFTQFQVLGGERRASAHDSLRGSLLGPRFTNEDIHGFLRSQQIEHLYCPDEHELLQKTAAAMREGKVVGWFQGRMEFSPHALGARSILREACTATFEASKHASLKNGNSLQSSVVSVLIQDAPAFFDLERESPYVHLVARQGEKSRLLKRRRDNAAEEGDVAAYLDVPSCAAANHSNGDIAARIQTVDEQRCGRYYRLIRELKRQTGSGMILNSDFSMPGAPIVGTPQEAYRCFMASDIDMLVLESCIVYKHQPSSSKVAQRKE